MNLEKIILISLSILISNSIIANETKNTKWKIANNEWSNEDELNYEKFISLIGNAREKNQCSNVENCLKSPIANPMYYKKNPIQLKVFSDCADLPFILRAYFSWMNDLPFTFPVNVEKVEGYGDRDSIEIDPNVVEDIRYTVNGNKITNHYLVKNGDDINNIFKTISDSVSSAMYRIHPRQNVENNLEFPDFYSVKINRDSIKPGTILYDPAGHVLIVYKIENNGRIKLIDAHPDNSLTRQIYGDKFMRDNPGAGAGFKAFRPFKIIQNKIIAATNEDLANYSTEQYYGTIPSRQGWEKGKFVLNKVKLDFYEYVKTRMSKGEVSVDPLYDFNEMLTFLCDDLNYRNEAVQNAINNKINLKNHPDNLPQNIYGTDGEWETFSTPSRDSRFKASIKELRNLSLDFIARTKKEDTTLKYNGSNIKNDLLTIYNQISRQCVISYTDSKNKLRTLNLDQAINRVYLFSFDPYHCPELRWGETNESLSSCNNSSEKKEWYSAEEKLRNSIKRDYLKFMAFDRFELPGSDLGVSTPENISIREVLEP